MLKVRGVNLWPQQVEQLLLSHPMVRDFRAEVRRSADGGDELLLRIATRGAPEADALDALSALVREKTMVRPRLVVDASLPDNVGLYKVRRWEDQRKTAAPAA